MVKACIGANGFTPFVAVVAALSLYVLIEEFGPCPLVQLGEGLT